MENLALTLTWDQVAGILAVIGMGVLTFVLVTHSHFGPVIKQAALFAVQKKWPNDTPLWINVLILIASVIWVCVFSLLLYNLVVHLIPDALLGATPQTPDDKNERRWLMVSLTALVATLGAVVALPFTLIKTRQNERQTKATEEGLITDRINSAVAGLGAEKTVDRIGRVVTVVEADETQDTFIQWKGEPPFVGIVTETGKWQVFSETQPNLEVRIGAILALERLARKNLDIHVQIMEILCAYVRENAPASSAKKIPELEIAESEELEPLLENWKKRLTAFHGKLYSNLARLKPREDIQVALTVLGRRNMAGFNIEALHNNTKSEAKFIFNELKRLSFLDDDNLAVNRKPLQALLDKFHDYKGYRLNLQHTNLQGVKLAQLNFAGALFNWSQMQGANFEYTQMNGAIFDGANLQGARLNSSQCIGASFNWARMQSAALRDALLIGASFEHSYLQDAHFSNAKMQNASLNEAGLQGASLINVKLWNACLRGVRMQGADVLNLELLGADLTWAKVYSIREWQTVSMDYATVKGVDFRSQAYMRKHIVNSLKNLFGDSSTMLPGDLASPSHWPKFDVRITEFYEEWEKWKTDPANYVPPDPPSRT